MNSTVKELHKKRMKMWDKSIANHKKYIDLETGIFKEKYTEDRMCPVCKSNNHNHLEMFFKEGGRYVKCQECSMVFLNPVFKDLAIKDYYESNHAEQSEIVQLDSDNFYTDIYDKGLDDIQIALPSISNILDIGCSSGVFLDVANKRGLRTFGIELNESEYRLAKNKNHKIYNKLLESITFTTRFNAITMWDVFEHIKDGEIYLNKMKSLLSDDGVIFLQIPSSDSLAAKVLWDKCNMFDGLEHVNLYGVKTIKKLVDKCGLKVLSLKTIISEIGVINNYINYEAPYLGDTKNKEFIPNLINEEKIHKTLQGYKIQIILGKEQ